MPSLRELCASGHQVVGVLTQPAKPSGRNKVLTPTPVALVAQECGLKVFTPDTPEGIVEAVSSCSPDIGIVVAYGRILTDSVRSSVTLGWWNVHFSLLPRWRGAAPVPHAIEAGDTETGITIFQIDGGLDTGPIALQQRFPIAAHDTTETLLGKLGKEAPTLVLRFLDDLVSGSTPLSPQVGEVSVAPIPSRLRGHISWSDNAAAIYRAFRAWSAEPGCFTKRSDSGQLIKIVDMAPLPEGPAMEPGRIRVDREGVLIGTATTPLVLERVKPAGKSEMSALDWVRGLPSGVVLGG